MLPEFDSGGVKRGTLAMGAYLDPRGIHLCSFPLAGHCGDMPAAFWWSNLVVNPSVKPESYGRTTVEAQDMGKPVVASSHDGSLETVRHHRTGWLFTAGDPSDLADMLKEVPLNPEQPVRFGANGQAWVRSRFTAQRMCQATLALYEQLIKVSKYTVTGGFLIF
jgi:glycosyltransferase involved in cell wall biosynthesis